MTAGFQSFNDGNTVQIDQDYAGFALRQKGSVNMIYDTDPHPNPMRIGSVTVTGAQNPIVAFNGPAAIAMHGVQVSGSTRTFQFRAQSSSDFTMNYWVFDNAAVGQGINTGFGLQVFKADGTLAWDSNMKTLRVVDVINITPPTDTQFLNSGGLGMFGYTESIPVPAGRVYAAVQGTFYFAGTQIDARRTPGNVPPGFKFMDLNSYHSAANVGATTAAAGMYRFESGSYLHAESTPDTVNTDGDLMHWIVDVTGY
jgi:hypothetical protein